MNYSKVYIESIGYELPAEVVTTEDLESRLSPVYEKLRIGKGQLQALTGIVERRWWPDGFRLSSGAAAAAQKALAKSEVSTSDIGVLIYAGVCREQFEPATACAVANSLGISSDAYIYDLSNACLGMLNGIIDIANRIELKQIRAGMVVSCESSREINEVMIQKMLEDRSMERFTKSLATLTGGSGAAAILLTDGSFSKSKRRRLIGAASKAAPQHHQLCQWGTTQSVLQKTKPLLHPDKWMAMFEQLFAPEKIPAAIRNLIPSPKFPAILSKYLSSEKKINPLTNPLTQVMWTDSVGVLKHGVDLGMRTWNTLLTKLGWAGDQVDKVICHQVGSGHRDTILEKLKINPEKDYSTYKYLGNIGTVSLPLTAAIAEQRNFLQPGDRVGFLGIGSGLNCLMLGWQW